MSDLNFANPEWFYAFLLIPLLIVWYIWYHKKLFPQLQIAHTGLGNLNQKILKVKLRHLPFILRIFTLIFVIIVLARPQTSSSKKNIETEGIDIIISLDISSSMLAQDFKPDRLEAAKKTAFDFIDKRINDRIGLVVFAAESYTQCPVTIDHDVLKNLFKGLKSGLLTDGTAIGMGLATSINRLKDSKAKSKIIILLTDGVNNTGIISPQTAAELAKTFNIRVYTIGIGSYGYAPYPVQTPWGIVMQQMKVEIDEKLLQSIANLTGGKYFRATNKKGLQKIYDEIDKMEKTKIDVSVYTKKTEVFLTFAIIATILFVCELLIKYLYLKRIP